MFLVERFNLFLEYVIILLWGLGFALKPIITCISKLYYRITIFSKDFVLLCFRGNEYVEFFEIEYRFC